MKYIIASFIGAIIGYITNWLAIKMLFRPYTEKRIFKKRIPFTPGLIPKEKIRIAKSVGNTIGEHLLDNKTLVEFLNSEKINNAINKCIEKEVNKIKNSDKCVEQKLYEFLGVKYKNIEMYLKTESKKYALRCIKKKEAKDKIINIISSVIAHKLKKSPEVILNSQIYKNIKKNILQSIIDCKNSQEISIKIEHEINNKIQKFKDYNFTLKQVIPSMCIDQFKKYVCNNSDKLAYELKVFLNEQNTKAKIKKIVIEMLNANLNPMIGMFINKDNIFEKVMNAINLHLKKQENQKELAQNINNFFEKILNNKIEDIISNMSDEAINDNVKGISKEISNKLFNEEFVRYVITLIENNIKGKNTLEEVIKEIDKYNDFNYRRVIDKIVNELVESTNTEFVINEFIDSIFTKIQKTKIKMFINENSEELIIFIKTFIKKLFKEFVEKKGEDIVKIFNVSEIVEKKINSFDVDFAEKIILEISNKELKAITWLGALLGAIMGLLSPLLSALWK